MLLKLWTRPSNYIGAEWPDYYVFLGRTRDSDCLTNSNFDCGLAAVKAVTSTDCVLVYENHWACGWVEWIAIHKSDTAAVECAERILERLDGYPVLDEDDWSRREDEEAQRVWHDCVPAHSQAYPTANKTRTAPDARGCNRHVPARYSVIFRVMPMS